MKRIVMGLMAMVLLLSSLPLAVSAEAVEATVDGFDCTRDAGKLIVYTDEYGETTGTNQWGMEAVVGSDNRVKSITKGNAPIPEGGFVVSGHDDEEHQTKFMKTWILKNIAIGDYVYVDKRSSMLTVSETEQPKQSPFYSFDNPADGVNVPRGENQMILYTAAHGLTTGTGEYGYEVVIEDGIVTKLGGNNSEIPRNGYVVSLHGSVARWMRLKIVKGMVVECDTETLNVVFRYSAEGLQKAATYAFDSVQNAIEEAKTTFVYADHAATQTALDALRAEYDGVLKAFQKDGDENDFADACDDLIKRADRLVNSLCESYTVQYRGAWLRPSQKNAKQVEEFVKKLHDASINFVCVEGWFENGVIMEVPEDSLFGRNPQFDFDVLQAYIDACHKYDMECHLWMPILNVGSFLHDGYEENTVTGRKPEWLSLNNLGQPYNKYGFMMIDPANKEACDYLLDFYKYIVTTYDIDCFEMDYIRYYETSLEQDFGYTEAAFEGFEKAYGYGVTPKYNKQEEYWEDWCQFRRDCVTQLVRDIRAMINEEAPDMMLAADVAFPFEHALDKVYQNFPQWLEEGLVDILHPMAYGDGYGDEIMQTVALGGERCMVVTGLGAQTDILGATELERQAREDNTYGAYGDCYFEANTYFSDQVPAAVKETVYRNDAIPPFLDVEASLAVSLDYMLGRVDDIIVPLGGMSEAEVAAVKQAIADAKASIEEGAIAPKKIAALREAVMAVVNENAKLALAKDLYRTEQIQCVKQNATREDIVKNTAANVRWIVSIAAVVFVLAVAAMIVVIVRHKKSATDADAEAEQPDTVSDEASE